MGFLSQIVNRFLPTKPHSTAADGWENPFQSSAGHIVTSESESWQARQARLGGMNQSNYVKMSCPAGSATTVLSVRTNPGRLGFVQYISVSTDVAGVAYIGGMAKYIPAGGSFDLKLDGAYLIPDTGIDTKFKPDTGTANATATCMWMEVEA